MLHFQAFTRHVGSIALCARSKCLPTIARRSYSVDGEPKTAIEELSQLLNDNDKRKLRYIKNEVRSKICGEMEEIEKSKKSKKFQENPRNREIRALKRVVEEFFFCSHSRVLEKTRDASN